MDDVRLEVVERGHVQRLGLAEQWERDLLEQVVETTAVPSTCSDMLRPNARPRATGSVSTDA